VTGLRFSTIRLATGPRLHYAEHGLPNGDPIVFLHGWPDSWFSFSLVVPLLPSRLHALVPDQRGFGESDRPDDRLVAAIKGAGLMVYQETGHCPTWERPELVAADLQEFLQQA
jgi:pimeloyl-ACP methyl ester carboxylesterase